MTSSFKKLLKCLFIILILFSHAASWGANACYDLFRTPVQLVEKTLNTKQIISFENIYTLMAKELATQNMYVRRPTVLEINQAISEGKFPDTPEVRASLAIVQTGVLDYSKPGKIVLFKGNMPLKKWNQDLDFESVAIDMKKQIEAGEIINEISLLNYKNTLTEGAKAETGVGGNKADRILLITLKDGTRGVFKSMSLHQAVAETASYQLSRAMNLRLVPPTVIVKYKDQVGSFQFFIENPATGLIKEHGASRENKVLAEDMANMEIFYIVSGNWDAHPGNRVIDLKGGLGLIDNEAITRPQFYRYGELPWFALMQEGKTNKEDFIAPASDAFPYHEAQYFNKPNVKNVKPILKGKGYDISLLESKLLWYDQDSGRVGIIDWQGSLWFQLNIPEYYKPRIPKQFPVNTMKAIADLTPEKLKDIFQNPFAEFNGQNIFKDVDLQRMRSRIDELIKAQQQK